MQLSIVSAGLGNIKSIRRMVEHLGGSAEIVDDPAALDRAERVVLPGVGAFDHGMTLLAEQGWIEPLNRAALERRVPVLGICLGMQLMCRGSEEGVLPGLGWIAADVRRLDTGGDPRLKVPHIGWTPTMPVIAGDILPDGPDEQRYYYVHSFRAACDDRAEVLATASHGTVFDAAFRKGNLRGVQFHPEKSHRFGMAVLQRFLALPC